uniref:Polymerase beta nucleotidyltransferase domain-containing protein n=1 Tax=Magnetococcus massalia (strain MO-1) TaxID=451514 RepID=A0A1S7LMR4_MAGMO|nr:conserved protein of unknown function [Candidatus Magnetococcus massalia]
MGPLSPSLQLSKKEQKLITRLLAEQLPGRLVWAYGARVTGQGDGDSDLDLVVFIPTAEAFTVYTLQESLEQSGLPFRVELLIWNQVPQSLKQTIQASHLVLQSGPQI